MSREGYSAKVLEGGIAAWKQAGLGVMSPDDPMWYRWRGEKESEHKEFSPS